MKAEASSPVREKVIAVNRKAYHDYHIEATVEAGLVLMGSEIKSIRAGKVNIRDAYAKIEKGEAWLLNAHVSAYKEAGQYFGHEPLRPRKLLLHSNEIGHLLGKMQSKGLTLIPLKLYLKRGRAKVELGLAKGKKLYDKREALAERESQREVERELKYR